jgi:hypothetical protein
MMMTLAKGSAGAADTRKRNGGSRAAAASDGADGEGEPGEVRWQTMMNKVSTRVAMDCQH